MIIKKGDNPFNGVNVKRGFNQTPNSIIDQINSMKKDKINVQKENFDPVKAREILMKKNRI